MKSTLFRTRIAGRFLGALVLGAFLLSARPADAQTDLIIGNFAPGTFPVSGIVPGLTVVNIGQIAQNLGATPDPAATVQIPLAFCQTVTWTCTPAGTGACGAASGTSSINETVNLPAGQAVTYAVQCVLKSDVPGPTLSQAFTVTSSIGDTQLANNTYSYTVGITPQADLSITITDGVVTAIPGTFVTYTVTTINNGPSDAPAAVVSVPMPAGISSWSWSCVAITPGSSCGVPNGTGGISNVVNIPAGATVQHVITALVDGSATGTVVANVSVSPGAGVTETSGVDNNAADVDTLTPQADLSITKTDGVTTAVAGGSVTYTITASNSGPSNVTGGSVVDTFNPFVTATGWTCVGAGGGTCTASGAGPINDTVNLPVGGSVTYTVSAAVSGVAAATISNTALALVPPGVVDPNPGNDSATDTDTVVAQADLAITMTDGVTTATPGGSVTYTITVTSTGPTGTAATVNDTFPPELLSVSWTCVGAGGGICTASGSGNINDTINLLPGQSVTYTVSATISAAATGTLVNTAVVAAMAPTTDTNPGNNSATDTDSLTLTSFSGPSATGTGTITASFPAAGGCTFAAPQFIGPPPGAPPIPPTVPPTNPSFPHGLFDFSVTGCAAAQSLTFTITYPQPLPSFTKYWKYGPTAANPTPHWYVLPATIAGNTVTFTIVDGGVGDDDLTANGTIVDQGGPGAGGPSVGVPTLDPRALALLVLLMMAVAAVTIRRRG